MKCTKCKHDLFKIHIEYSCGDCEHNPAWDEDEKKYTLDHDLIRKKGLIRNCVANEGECDMGPAYDNGCYIFTCSKCLRIDYLPMLDQ
jgi:hypothetical protein